MSSSGQVLTRMKNNWNTKDDISGPATSILILFLTVHAKSVEELSNKSETKTKN